MSYPKCVARRQSDTGYKCPTCGKATSVTDSRPSENGWRRRRTCPCGHRFTTYELEIDPAHDIGSQISAALAIVGQATNALLDLRLQLNKMSERAEIMGDLDAKRYGNAGRANGI